MSAEQTRYFIVHSPNGRILAAAPVSQNRQKPAFNSDGTSCWTKPRDFRN